MAEATAIVVYVSATRISTSASTVRDAQEIQSVQRRSVLTIMYFALLA